MLPPANDWQQCLRNTWLSTAKSNDQFNSDFKTPNIDGIQSIHFKHMIIMTS